MFLMLPYVTYGNRTEQHRHSSCSTCITSVWLSGISFCNGRTYILPVPIHLISSVLQAPWCTTLTSFLDFSLVVRSSKPPQSLKGGYVLKFLQEMCCTIYRLHISKHSTLLDKWSVCSLLHANINIQYLYTNSTVVWYWLCKFLWSTHVFFHAMVLQQI